MSSSRASQDEFYVLPLPEELTNGTHCPQRSVSQLVERFDNPQQPADGGRPDESTTALFFIDLPGYYTAELRVTDQFGLLH